jgi:hypothetical protein
VEALHGGPGVEGDGIDHRYGQFKSGTRLKN